MAIIFRKTGLPWRLIPENKLTGQFWVKLTWVRKNGRPA
jgi:hypothetical protein